MQVFVNLQQINVDVCLGLQTKHSVNEAAVRPLALSVPPPDQVYMPDLICTPVFATFLGLEGSESLILLGKIAFFKKKSLILPAFWAHYMPGMQVKLKLF